MSNWYARQQWAYMPETAARWLQRPAAMAAPQHGTDVIWLCGDPTEKPLTPDEWRAWALAAAVPQLGWADAGTRVDGADPVVRLRHADGARITIRRITAWWPAAPTAADAGLAHTRLDDLLQGTWHGTGACVLATPAQTGAVLWRRSLAARKQPITTADIPVLPEEDRALFRGVAPQGRIELLAYRHLPDTLPHYRSYDATAAYLGLCRELGTGPLVRDELPTYAPYTHGLYRAAWSPPLDWQHIGLAPVANADGQSWDWPDSAVSTHLSWLTAPVVDGMIAAGWRLDITRRALLTGKQRPLDLWADRLKTLYDLTRAADQNDPDPIRALVRSGIRAIALHTIGSFARTAREEERPVRTADIAATVAVADQRTLHDMGGDLWTYRTTAPLPASSADLQHPEFAHTIWARMQDRINRWALALPRESLLAIATDCIDTTADVSEWNRRAAPIGQLRCKAFCNGPVRTPRTLGDAHALRKTFAL